MHWQEFGMLYIELIPESIVFQFVLNSHLQPLLPSSSHSNSGELELEDARAYTSCGEPPLAPPLASSTTSPSLFASPRLHRLGAEKTGLSGSWHLLACLLYSLSNFVSLITVLSSKPPTWRSEVSYWRIEGRRRRTWKEGSDGSGECSGGINLFGYMSRRCVGFLSAD
jgi:hypothetical protein